MKNKLFKESKRYNYNLTEDSVVFDLGGYKGRWTEKIYKKYKPNIHLFEIVPDFAGDLIEKFSGKDKIKIYPYGLSNKSKGVWVSVDGGSSTIYSPVSIETIYGNLMDVLIFFTEHRIGVVDVMKINIEGGEYDLLNRLIASDLINKINNIQVQFHNFHPKCEQRVYEIREKLKLTHRLTFRHDWKWENWIKFKSYSQVGQDLFVRSMLPFDFQGFFLDLGCKWPEKINNTKLLEECGWDGLSIDIDDYSDEWTTRTTQYLHADALTIDYNQLHLPKVIDYLSLDINPHPGARYDALKKLTDAALEFKVITIEHEKYLGYIKEEVEPQRKLLKSLGYEIYREDVEDNGYAFEDWWVNPKYINK